MLIPSNFSCYHQNTITDSETITKFDLVASNGRDKFAIYYYGEILPNTQHLIVATDFAPQLIIAREPQSHEEIVLFDGIKHGYNAMFCDEYSDKQRQNRPLTLLNEKLFRVQIQVFYNIDYQTERDDFEDEKGRVTLLSGEVIDFQELENDGFDALCITIIDENQQKFELVNEELA